MAAAMPSVSAAVPAGPQQSGRHRRHPAPTASLPPHSGTGRRCAGMLSPSLRLGRGGGVPLLVLSAPP